MDGIIYALKEPRKNADMHMVLLAQKISLKFKKCWIFSCMNLMEDIGNFL